MNVHTAQSKLEMLLAANFDTAALFCTLTYRDDCRPQKLAEAKKRIRGFIKVLRTQRRRKGQELKYVYVTEGRHGDKLTRCFLARFPDTARRGGRTY